MLWSRRILSTAALPALVACAAAVGVGGFAATTAEAQVRYNYQGGGSGYSFVRTRGRGYLAVPTGGSYKTHTHPVLYTTRVIQVAPRNPPTGNYMRRQPLPRHAGRLYTLANNGE